MKQITKLAVIIPFLSFPAMAEERPSVNSSADVDLSSVLPEEFSNQAEFDQAIPAYIDGKGVSNFFQERGVSFEQGAQALQELGGENNEYLIDAYKAYEQSKGLTEGESKLSKQVKFFDDTLEGIDFSEIKEISEQTSKLTGGFDLESSGISAGKIEGLQKSLDFSREEVSALASASSLGSGNVLNNGNKFLNGPSEATTKILEGNFSNFITSGKARYSGIQNSIQQGNGAALTQQLSAYAAYLNSSLNNMNNQLSARGIEYSKRNLALGFASSTGDDNITKMLDFNNGRFSVKQSAVTDTLGNY